MTREEEINKAAAEFVLSDKTETPDFHDAINDFYYGAKWADETMVEKACEWLQRELAIETENVENIKEFHTIVARRFNDMNAFIEGFKKVMES